jgi:hypothetical protein
MPRWSRNELEEAFDRYQAAAQRGAYNGDWKEWVDCFTPDATYLECQDGHFWGRESILKWITDLMSPWPAREMTAFPVAWYTIDEDKGWIICEVRNRMNDLGDGRIYEETNMTVLHYAGNGHFSCEIDVYNPRRFGEMFRDWVTVRLEKAEPEERERLAGELRDFMQARANVDRNGPGASR